MTQLEKKGLSKENRTAYQFIYAGCPISANDAVTDAYFLITSVIA